MTSPLIFRGWQTLALAVICQFEEEAERERKKLLKEKAKLMERLELKHYFAVTPLWAWEQWEKEYLDYEIFIAYRKSPVYQLYIDVINCEVRGGNSSEICRMKKRLMKKGLWKYA